MEKKPKQEKRSAQLENGATQSKKMTHVVVIIKAQHACLLVRLLFHPPGEGSARTGAGQGYTQHSTYLPPPTHIHTRDQTSCGRFVYVCHFVFLFTLIHLGKSSSDFGTLLPYFKANECQLCTPCN